MNRDHINKVIQTGLTLAVLVLASSAQAAPGAKSRWMTYKSNMLQLQVSVPEDWKAVKSPNALAFHADDLTGGTGAIGILKSEQSGGIEELADKQFEREGRPADWVRTPAKVDGMRAIKIVGLMPNNPDRKMVHYYIETSRGNYLVQCQATAERWSTFGPTFATILSKLKFLAL